MCDCLEKTGQETCECLTVWSVWLSGEKRARDLWVFDCLECVTVWRKEGKRPVSVWLSRVCDCLECVTVEKRGQETCECLTVWRKQGKRPVSVSMCKCFGTITGCWSFFEVTTWGHCIRYVAVLSHYFSESLLLYRWKKTSDVVAAIQTQLLKGVNYWKFKKKKLCINT